MRYVEIINEVRNRSRRSQTYFERFGVPQLSAHVLVAMAKRGITPAQLNEALGKPARPGTSPGTIMFVAERTTVVVNEANGTIVTAWLDLA